MKKLLYLLLLTPIIYLTSCSKSGVSPEVDNLYGCTDTLAFNFDSLANTNDSSCCYIAGCTIPNALNYDANACYDDTSCTYPLAIGDSYQGGIIFYLDLNGGGLIAAPSDQSTSAIWGCHWTDPNGGNSVPGTLGSAIGTGAQNTINIINANCFNSMAANICDTLTLGGYSDWFLPSIDELKLLRSTYWNFIGLRPNPTVGGFTNNVYYWSSTRYNNPNQIGAWGNFAEMLYFGLSNGDGTSVGNTNTELPVRAIRAF